MVIHKIISKILGDPNEKYLKKITPLVKEINDFEEKYQKEIKAEEIPQKTEEFKKRIADGESLDKLLPEAFALVKYACRTLVGTKWDVRGNDTEWDMIPYDVQLIGGITLHQGKISEMKTGEGKTLVCTMPIYLNTLAGKGVHVVTVNEYLAHRDAEWMGGVYKQLGLTTGIIGHGMSHQDKKDAYNCDVTYGTNNEFGFDYLRDNMANQIEHCVQRSLNYAIIDEVDSILIDEARTPLIISAPAAESTSKYYKYSQLIPLLTENTHYNIDEKMKTAVLSEEGIAKMEELLNVENIYTDAGLSEVHHLEQALKAQTVYKRDTDYVVKDDEVIIVDEFTGRLMPGRRYSDGLHQAIEAKEGVEVQRESRTLATITFQNYFRLFKKLGGMTGTALTESEEFYKIYGLDTIEIPTNLPIKRDDLPDAIFKNQDGKFKAVAKKVKELNEKGQPVLIGTISIETSEHLSRMLKSEGVKHHVLNAKHHEQEAEIVANAGQKNAVTIATNMAGRGTDIKLGAGVKELGGLAVLGTERHESRRIDNQLRGRAGRQGDPGATQFFVSMEDSLMRLFGSDRIKTMMNMLNFPEDMPIENRMISKAIESSQKRVEGHNFDIRKHIVEYDDVMNKQRGIIYSQRRKMLESQNVKNDIILLIEKEIEGTVLAHTAGRDNEWNRKEIFETINTIHKDPVNPIALEDLEKIAVQEEMIDKLKKYLYAEYEEKEKLLPDNEILRAVERDVYLKSIDTLWMEHIDEMAGLRDAVSLRGYGQRDPLLEYKQDGFEKFQKLLATIQSNTVYTLFHLRLQKPADMEIKAESGTQVTMINDQAVTANLTDDKQNIEETAQDMESKGQAVSMPPIFELKGNETPHNLQTNRGEGSSGASSSTSVPKKSKVGRNDPCSCGSGKKYKKCCDKN